MNVFDKFLTGDIENINFCFENTHFLERLNENGISREYIVDCILEEEPIKSEHVKDNLYEVIYKAPQNKDYREIRVIIACADNSIDMITVMRNNETTTSRQNRQFHTKERKKIDKMTSNARLKRKW